MADIAHTCADIDGLRQLVHRTFHLDWGPGNCWLPIVNTARGALFAEVIGQNAQGAYFQPLDLTDRQRQPLYRLGFQLLDYLQAPPAVYLLQFQLSETGAILFDRLIPFPDKPAMASIGVQEPDLFECHWRCITHQPVRDVIIRPTTTPLPVWE